MQTRKELIERLTELELAMLGPVMSKAPRMRVLMRQSVTRILDNMEAMGYAITQKEKVDDN